MATGPLIAIVGQTGTGKTALAIELAKRFDGEIICADSRTVYKGMDIGTAKPTAEERASVPHHLLDVVSPKEPFTVAQFKRLADQTIENIQQRGKLPMLAGGSGLYVDAVLYDFGFTEGERDTKNPRHRAPGGPLNNTLRGNTLILEPIIESESLKRRISRRVDSMVEQGLVEEIQKLAREYGWDIPAMQAPAYRAFRGYIEGGISLDEAKQLFIKSDLKLAKKQKTWFERNNSIHKLSDLSEVVDLVTTFLNKSP